jgi:hypothetical protein
MKKIYILLPLIVWFGLVIAELYSLFFQFPKPMYFRAWEYALNQGKDSYYVSFQPHVTYKGTMSGDLLLLANFRPKKSEIKPQLFVTDEYGFRNPVGLLQKPVDVVLLGTSFVGGAQETQSGLVSDMLTNKYKIPTYNYATMPLQHLWADDRFFANPPKYVFIVGNETEILQNIWTETLVENKEVHHVVAWNSHEEWAAINNPFPYDYKSVSAYLKRFSYIRYLAKDMNRHYQNELFTREQLGESLIKSETYDPERDILFWDINEYDPRLSDVGRTRVASTVEILKKSKEILSQRNITMVMGVVPSKSSLHAKRYRDVNIKDRTIYLLQKEFEKNNIEYVNVSDPLFEYVSKTGNLVYYPDDSHWNTKVNELLSELLAEKIKNKQ